MKCIRCQKNDKVGYKYCEECKIEVRAEHNRKYQDKRRKKALKLCDDCREKLTKKKLCKSCAQKKEHKKVLPKKKNVKRKPRKKVEYVQKTIHIDPKWLVRGNISTSSRESVITCEA